MTGLALALRIAFVASLTVALGSGQAPLNAAATVQQFDPVAFFSGTTVGTGTLKKAFSPSQATHVTGFGVLRGDGLLVLDQTVAIAGEEVKDRQWRLRQTAPGQYAGSISDATGPVVARVSGNRLTISYKMPGSMSVQQVLTIAQGGQSAQNAMKFRKFGIVAATLNETIRRK